MKVLVQEAGFDLGAQSDAFAAGVSGAGAIVTFTGVVRDADAGGLVAMEIEHYPGMTERSIAELIVQARQRFDVHGVRVIHRVGPLAVAEQIVLVAVTSAHRQQAFDCAAFLMDWLKTSAPFWKKEIAGADARWVDARESDEAAARRWQLAPTGEGLA